MRGFRMLTCALARAHAHTLCLLAHTGSVADRVFGKDWHAQVALHGLQQHDQTQGHAVRLRLCAGLLQLHGLQLHLHRAQQPRQRGCADASKGVRRCYLQLLRAQLRRDGARDQHVMA